MDEATATKTRLAAQLCFILKKAGPANSKAYHTLADRAETGVFDRYLHMCAKPETPPATAPSGLGNDMTLDIADMKPDMTAGS